MNTESRLNQEKDYLDIEINKLFKKFENNDLDVSDFVDVENRLWEEAKNHSFEENEFLNQTVILKRNLLNHYEKEFKKLTI